VGIIGRNRSLGFTACRWRPRHTSCVTTPPRKVPTQLESGVAKKNEVQASGPAHRLLDLQYAMQQRSTACLWVTNMSTTNEVESPLLPTGGPILNPRQESFYSNPVAKGSSAQWNGHQNITNNIGAFYAGNHALSAGNLNSPVHPPSTGLGGNQPLVPRNLSAARPQINGFQIPHVRVPGRVASPDSDQRPRSSPHLSIRSNRGSRPVRNCCPKNIFGKVFNRILIIVVLLVWSGVFIMLVFGAGDGSS
jgi:hypothetical protein